MGWNAKRVWIAGEVLADGLSSLAEIHSAPVEVNGDEASDWGLVGDDLREAMNEARTDDTHDDELVEA